MGSTERENRDKSVSVPTVATCISVACICLESGTQGGYTHVSGDGGDNGFDFGRSHVDVEQVAMA